MGIQTIYTDFAGQINAFPRLIKITTTDSYSTILKANYITQVVTLGYTLLPTDMILMTFGSGETQLFSVNQNGTTWTLIPQNAATYFDVTVTYSQLVAAGTAILLAASGSEQYKIRQLYLNSNGTNFSGGDREGEITDGTTAYSIIPAASMQTLVNSAWGSTALPFPASAAINTSTVAGANLIFQYTGGTTDYTAGSLVISGIAERIA